MSFIKHLFSQTGTAIVNLICLSKSLEDSATVKPTSAVIWDN